ncbi:MAG: 5-carboxymethyl-2-hydroxymuconate delta-isomerase [Firmicutes bacterium]|nr:5-carboxymethyl-2-hydroxymuconate delta-isomerase [Bacillota bacterium]
MKYVRIMFEGKPHWGELFKTTVHVLDQAPYAGGSWIGRKIELSDAVILAPCEPSKIVAVGKNYHDHIKEFDAQIPDRPILFIKPSSAIQDPQKPIVLPPPNLAQRVDYEGELALVIGKKASHIQADQAADYILGYTILNDVTARDIQKLDVQWTRAKSFDTFAPIGPVITDEVDPADLQITTTLNGHVRQQESTARLIWGIGELLAFITQVMTLLPGDVVTTGTPAGVGPMLAGDVVTVTIEGIGTLSNPVIAG